MNEIIFNTNSNFYVLVDDISGRNLSKLTFDEHCTTKNERKADFKSCVHISLLDFFLFWAIITIYRFQFV